MGVKTDCQIQKQYRFIKTLKPILVLFLITNFFRRIQCQSVAGVDRCDARVRDRVRVRSANLQRDGRLQAEGGGILEENHPVLVQFRH